jgi:hypothetical protein
MRERAIANLRHMRPPVAAAFLSAAANAQTTKATFEHCDVGDGGMLACVGDDVDAGV